MFFRTSNLKLIIGNITFNNFCFESIGNDIGLI